MTGKFLVLCASIEGVCDRIMEKHITRGVVIYSLQQSHSCDQSNEGETKSSCGTCGGGGGGGGGRKKQKEFW